MLIGDVARRCGVSARMLRHYDTLGLVRPTGRTAGGYREYTSDDVRRIFHVESLRSLGLSLQDIGRVFEDREFTPSGLVADLIRRTEDRLQAEKELLERLRAVDSSEPGAWDDVLRIVELLRGLASPSATRRQQTALSAADDVPLPADVLARSVLAESDPIVAGALRWALAKTGHEGVSAVSVGLDSEQAAVRRGAVRALAEVEGREATAALLRALEDPDADVREHAALALGERGEPAAVTVLADMVVTGSRDILAAEALGIVARHAGGKEASIVDSLAEALAEHPADPAVRLRLTQALAELPGDAASHMLRDLTRDADRAVALTASAIRRMRPGAAPDESR